LSYALKGKLPTGLCLIIIGTERFSLSLHPDKTRLIEFGRCGAELQEAWTF